MYLHGFKFQGRKIKLINMGEPIHGKLLTIAIKSDDPDGHMKLLKEAEVSTETGVANDPRGKRKDRQVTVLTIESWEAACVDLGEQLPWTTRRANLLLEGVSLQGSMGKKVRIGSNVLMEITHETKPCHVMDEARKGLKAALTADCRGGVLCRVIAGGNIVPGDVVQIK